MCDDDRIGYNYHFTQLNTRRKYRFYHARIDQIKESRLVSVTPNCMECNIHYCTNTTCVHAWLYILDIGNIAYNIISHDVG